MASPVFGAHRPGPGTSRTVAAAPRCVQGACRARAEEEEVEDGQIGEAAAREWKRRRPKTD
eukprot:4759996-Prymnesium_polylepis.1